MLDISYVLELVEVMRPTVWCRRRVSEVCVWFCSGDIGVLSCVVCLGYLAYRMKRKETLESQQEAEATYLY